MEFKKKKRAEECAKESQKTKEKVYADYAWKDLCEDSTKLKQLRVPELNKYLRHHGIHQHIKSPKNDKVKVIAGHWLLQMNQIILYIAKYIHVRFNYDNVSFERGGHPQKMTACGGGGGRGHEKKWGLSGGATVIRNGVQKIPPAPLPRKKWTVPYRQRAHQWYHGIRSD